MNRRSGKEIAQSCSSLAGELLKMQPHKSDDDESSEDGEKKKDTDDSDLEKLKKLREELNSKSWKMGSSEKNGKDAFKETRQSEKNVKALQNELFMLNRKKLDSSSEGSDSDDSGAVKESHQSKKREPERSIVKETYQSKMKEPGKSIVKETYQSKTKEPNRSMVRKKSSEKNVKALQNELFMLNRKKLNSTSEDSDDKDDGKQSASVSVRKEPKTSSDRSNVKIPGICDSDNPQEDRDIPAPKDVGSFSRVAVDDECLSVVVPAEVSLLKEKRRWDVQESNAAKTVVDPYPVFHTSITSTVSSAIPLPEEVIILKEFPPSSYFDVPEQDGDMKAIGELESPYIDSSWSQSPAEKEQRPQISLPKNESDPPRVQVKIEKADQKDSPPQANLSHAKSPENRNRSQSPRVAKRKSKSPAKRKHSRSPARRAIKKSRSRSRSPPPRRPKSPVPRRRRQSRSISRERARRRQARSPPPRSRRSPARFRGRRSPAFRGRRSPKRRHSRSPVRRRSSSSSRTSSRSSSSRGRRRRQRSSSSSSSRSKSTTSP